MRLEMQVPTVPSRAELNALAKLIHNGMMTNERGVGFQPLFEESLPSVQAFYRRVARIAWSRGARP